MTPSDRVSLRRLVNMCAGLFGIQFAWGLQNANMSVIYECLGAGSGEIPMLWLAAPVTGLIVQPVIGSLSDRSTLKYGRRRPYLLVGAALSGIALFLMPHASSVFTAALLLWLLDTAVNTAVVPCRAFVGDLLPADQRTFGFAMQSLMIALGAVLASLLPWFMSHFSTEKGGSGGLEIPATVRWSYYGGAVLFLAAVIYTTLTTTEKPVLRKPAAPWRPTWHRLKTLRQEMVALPEVMRQLAVVQFFTWLSLFTLWIYFTPAIAHASKSTLGTADYARAVEWAGICFSVYNAVAFVASFVLFGLARRYSARSIHWVSLSIGGSALISVQFLSSSSALLLSMAGLGIAWASILSMPYAMIAAVVPTERIGYYMGLFNVFVVIPQIVGSITLGLFAKVVFKGSEMPMIVAAGVSMLIGAAVMALVRNPAGADAAPTTDPIFTSDSSSRGSDSHQYSK